MGAEQVKSLPGGRKVKIAVLLVVVFLAGYFLKSLSRQPPADQSIAKKWYCSMDPQVIEDKPGKCRVCGMDLVPMPTESIATAGPRELVVSEEAAKLMEIQTSVVERRFVTADIRMVGKVDYDETKVKNITAWVPGRIVRLFVDFTGITIKKGDHMVELYSPELIKTQRELLLSSTKSLARKKLLLLGLTAEQIDQIEKTKEPLDYLTIYAPSGGLVIHKNAAEGLYVDEGTKLFTIADLSRLWVKLDAYESDLPWVRYGQEVEFTTEAYSGDVFKGKIAFIDPVLNDKKRTVEVRVNVDNTDGRLKPDMFVRAVVHAEVAKGGRVMAPGMAGKWICYMHTDIVKDAPGTCDICGMDLVTAESQGFVVVDASIVPPLVIPASAALVTGRKLDRAVVYVQKPDAEKPTFEGREIVLGPRAGDYYIVKSGLAEGEIVVTNGNFKIDSEMQIRAKPSMMNPQGKEAPVDHRGHSH